MKFSKIIVTKGSNFFVYLFLSLWTLFFWRCVSLLEEWMEFIFYLFLFDLISYFNWLFWFNYSLYLFWLNVIYIFNFYLLWRTPRISIWHKFKLLILTESSFESEPLLHNIRIWFYLFLKINTRLGLFYSNILVLFEDISLASVHAWLYIIVSILFISPMIANLTFIRLFKSSASFK